MKEIIVDETLDKISLSILYKHFKEYNGCDWTLEQFIQSLKNQPYLKFLVFKKGVSIVGIVSYSISNPWNKIIYDVEYSINDDITDYMNQYKKEVLRKMIK